jgi:ferredoxin--NADP+ reductase
MSSLRTETVLTVRHWADGLFSFTTTRDRAFRFDSGMFTMIGLAVDGRPLLRAYSIASPAYAEHLEFLSVAVNNGPLTSRLRHIQPGDSLIVSAKPTGTLLLHNLKPGRTLYLLASGTGLAAFMGIVREPETYERFDRVVLMHSVRHVNELAYRDLLSRELAEDEFLGDFVAPKLIYCPTVTRQAFQRQARITELLKSSQFFQEFDLSPLDPANDRLMLCGSNAMLSELSANLEALGFIEGSNARPGDYVVEKAFAETSRSVSTIAA